MRVGAAYTQTGVLAKGGRRALLGKLRGWDASWDWRGHVHPQRREPTAGRGPPRKSPSRRPTGAKGLPRGRGLGCASGSEPRVWRPPGAPGEVSRLELGAKKFHEQRTTGPLLFESAPTPPSAGFNVTFEDLTLDTAAGAPLIFARLTAVTTKLL